MSLTRALAEDWPFVEKKDVPELVSARMERKEIVEGSRKFTFYVYEPVLYSPVGGPDVLAEQLYEIMRMAVRPYINFRIVPVGQARTGDFTMMTFPRYEPLTYVEGLNTALFLDDRKSVSLYQEMLKKLDRVALGEAESRKLIDRILTSGAYDPAAGVWPGGIGGSAVRQGRTQ